MTLPPLRTLTLSLCLTLPILATSTQANVLPSLSATAATVSQKSQPVSVYFLNGISNTDTQAQTSAIALFNRLKDDNYFAQLIDNRQVSLRTLYNPTDPLLGDIYELDAQAKIQKRALAATNARVESEHLADTYDAADLAVVRQAIYDEEIHSANQAYRAERYWKIDFIHTAGNRAIDHYNKMASEVKRSLLAGEKVVVVAHSQGNYVAQGLYANLAQDPAVRQSLSNNLKIVGVANVSATSPSGLYLTNADDQAVYLFHAIQGGQPMVANFTPRFANGEKLGGIWESKVQKQNDGQNHGFIETYLSARFSEGQDFVPHYPEIIDNTPQNTAQETAPKSIYSVIVTDVSNSFKRMLG